MKLDNVVRDVWPQMVTVVNRAFPHREQHWRDLATDEAIRVETNQRYFRRDHMELPHIRAATVRTLLFEKGVFDGGPVHSNQFSKFPEHLQEEYLKLIAIAFVFVNEYERTIARIPSVKDDKDDFLSIFKDR